MLNYGMTPGATGDGVPVQRIIKRLKISPAVFSNNCAGFIRPWLQQINYKDIEIDIP